jgi:hypothetical protein
MKLSVIYSLKVSTASVDENGWKNVSEEGGSKEANNISFLTIADQTESIIEDVLRIKTIRWYLLIFQFMDIFSM